MKQPHGYYLFGKSAIPETVDGELSDTVLRLKKLPTKEAYLKAAYDFVTTHYESGRVDTVLKLFELFSTDLQSLWNRKGFMHCTNQNYLLAVLLVRGGYFAESDIKRKWTLIGFYSPHQYLMVRTSDNNWIAADCWARHYGVGFGAHAHGFNTTMRRSFVDW